MPFTDPITQLVNGNAVAADTFNPVFAQLQENIKHVRSEAAAGGYNDAELRGRVGNLETSVEARALVDLNQNGRLDQVEAKNTAQDIVLAAIVGPDQMRLGNIESVNSAQNARLSVLESRSVFAAKFAANGALLSATPGWAPAPSHAATGDYLLTHPFGQTPCAAFVQINGELEPNGTGASDLVATVRDMSATQFRVVISRGDSDESSNLIDKPFSVMLVPIR